LLNSGKIGQKIKGTLWPLQVSKIIYLLFKLLKSLLGDVGVFHYYLKIEDNKINDQNLFLTTDFFGLFNFFENC